MKSIQSYILEALKSDEQKWLNNVYKVNQSLVKDNKLNPIEVDVKKLSKPKRPFEYDRYINDRVFKQIISDRQVGFVVSNQIITNPKQYLTDKDSEKELKPECYPYWYVKNNEENKENIYFIGLCLYDRNTTYIDSFIHLVSIESSLIISNSQDLNKGILNDFINDIIPKLGKYKGITVKPTHPKMKAIFLKLGFTIFKDNKDILIYKI